MIAPAGPAPIIATERIGAMIGIRKEMYNEKVTGTKALAQRLGRQGVDSEAALEPPVDLRARNTYRSHLILVICFCS